VSDGVFRPSGATAWSSYNTPRIWAMVEGEDDPESWRQVAALGSMASLLNDQRKRLEAARAALVEAWPPERNVSAAAFVELIDDLLLNMRHNKDVADANAGALGQILESLRQAKVDIAPLYRSYLDKSDDWVPAWWDNAEDELDEQARERMRLAESVIADPGNKITAPPLYELKPNATNLKIDDDDPGNGPQSGGRVGSGVGGSVSAGAGFAVPHEPPPPLPGQESSVPGGSDVSTPSGPGLAGVVTPPALPGGGLPAVPSSSPIAAGSTGPGLVIGGGAALLPPSPVSAGNLRPGAGGRFGTGGPGLPTGSGLRRGGLGPGGPAGRKPTTPSWLSPTSGQPPGSAGAGSRGPGAPGIPPAGGPRSRGAREDGMTFDPDNPWVTAEGVDPVIAPSAVIHRHDPGPAVIGWRR
jgi:hypothetical protein